MTAKKALRFKIGDWIVHYSHGIGKVIDIVEKVFEGYQETFFKVATSEIEYWLPINQADAEHIEPIRSKKDFDQAIQVVSKPPNPMSEPHNRNKKIIYERWLDGSLSARAALLRDLHGRNNLKELSYDEKEILGKIENFFIDEWIITNPSLSRLDAKQRLQGALEKSIDNKNTLPAINS